MKKKSLCVVITAAMFASACASYQPIVDTKGVDANKYNADLYECQQYAQQVSVGNQAAGGAVIGSLFGALLGAAIGGRDGMNVGARAGAVNGLAGGAANAATGQVSVVKNCMLGRGYKVLY